MGINAEQIMNPKEGKGIASVRFVTLLGVGRDSIKGRVWRQSQRSSGLNYVWFNGETKPQGWWKKTKHPLG